MLADDEKSGTPVTNPRNEKAVDEIIEKDNLLSKASTCSAQQSDPIFSHGWKVFVLYCSCRSGFVYRLKSLWLWSSKN